MSENEQHVDSNDEGKCPDCGAALEANCCCVGCGGPVCPACGWGNHEDEEDEEDEEEDGDFEEDEEEDERICGVCYAALSENCDCEPSAAYGEVQD